MGLIDKIKRDFARHRQKAAVLGVLAVVMIVLVVRAVVQLRPAPAAVVAAAVPPAADAEMRDEVAVTGASAEEQIKQSKELWKKLREVRGVDASVAFVFDSSLFPPDPNRKIVTSAPERIEPVAPRQVPDDSENQRRLREQSIRDQSRQLTVKSTTVTATGKPWAIVSNQLVTVGDIVNGFEVVAIRSREVDFKKENFTKTVKMTDDLRGQ
jgi:hypothetical protein